MTSPDRVAWVERKFAAHHIEKVIPPEEVARDVLVAHINTTIAARVEVRP